VRVFFTASEPSPTHDPSAIRLRYAAPAADGRLTGTMTREPNAVVLRLRAGGR
jgi:hypothetical protein